MKTLFPLLFTIIVLSSCSENDETTKFLTNENEFIQDKTFNKLLEQRGYSKNIQFFGPQENKHAIVSRSGLSGVINNLGKEVISLEENRLGNEFPISWEYFEDIKILIFNGKLFSIDDSITYLTTLDEFKRSDDYELTINDNILKLIWSGKKCFKILDIDKKIEKNFI